MKLYIYVKEAIGKVGEGGHQYLVQVKRVTIA